MRKKFIYYILIPAFLFLVVLYFFLDGWVEAGLELAGEAVVGARVEIDDLKLSLSPVGMEFARLQVADPKDPWFNTFETGSVRFSVDAGQLLRGKYIIETMEVNNLILGTKRSTDGSLPGKKPVEPETGSPAATAESGPGTAEGGSLSQEAKSVAEQKNTSAPMFDLDRLRKQLNIDSLLNVRGLRSVKHIDSLKTQVQQASQQWQQALRDLEQTKPRVAQIETNIKAINVGELKSIQGITDALKNVNEASKGIKEVSSTVTTRRTAVTDEINRLSASVKGIDDLVKEDYQGVLDLARLPDLSMSGIADLLLGKEVFAQADEYLSWIDFARKNVKNDSPDEDIESAPRRLRGQNIHFPQERAYPKFWIKKILVSGGTDASRDPNYFYAKGEIKNISSDQRATGFPLTVALTAAKGRGTTATFDAKLDRTGEVPVDNYKATLSGVPVVEMNLGRSDFLPSKVSKASTDYAIEVKVPGNKFDADARVRFSNVAITFSQPPHGVVERIVHDVLASVKQFLVMLRFWKENEGLKVALETDLDNRIAEGTKRVIGEEISRMRNEIRAKVDATIAAKRKELEALFAQKKDEVTGQLKTYEQLVSDKVALADGKKKELEDKIESEKKKQAGKAGDALKGLFKKKN